MSLTKFMEKAFSHCTKLKTTFTADMYIMWETQCRAGPLNITSQLRDAEWWLESSEGESKLAHERCRGETQIISKGVRSKALAAEQF